jgi:hypothetical protein
MHTHQFQSWKFFISLFQVCDIVSVTDFLCHPLTFVMQAYKSQHFENWIYILTLKRKTTESLCRKCHHGNVYHFRYVLSVRKLCILFRSAKFRGSADGQGTLKPIPVTDWRITTRSLLTNRNWSQKRNQCVLTSFYTIWLFQSCGR